MAFWINNLSGVTTRQINTNTSSDVLVIDLDEPRDAPAASDVVMFTLIELDSSNKEIAWEVVTATGCGAVGNTWTFSIIRNADVKPVWAVGTKVESRLEASSVNRFESSTQYTGDAHLDENNTWTGTNTFNQAVVSKGAGTGSLRLGTGGVGGTNQGDYGVAVGNGAALTGQTEYAVAVGNGSGRTDQGSNSIAIGRGAGYANQGDYGIIINSKGSQHNDTSEGHIILKSSQGELAFTQANGWNFSDSITCVGNITAYSDIRLKKEVSVISNPMDIVAGINGVKYTEIHTGKRRTGVIAQAVQEVLPEAVLEDSKGMLSVDYGNLVGVLFEAVKELKAEIEELKGAN